MLLHGNGRGIFMAQGNTALAEDLQGVGGGFMGLGTCQDKGTIFPKAKFSLN